MWRRSASFVLDNRLQQSSGTGTREKPSATASTVGGGDETGVAAATAVSGYYQARAEHHEVVSQDWLHQAEEAASGKAGAAAGPGGRAGRPFSVIDEFNYWRKKPDLAEAVAAIMALSAVIRASEATTMMELEIELKRASDALKVKKLNINPMGKGKSDIEYNVIVG